MSCTSSSAPYFFLFFSLILSITKGCIESERDALLQFKNGLSDPSDRLSDWVSDRSECCRWTGVVCHNVTFHVLELHLRTLSPEEYLGPERYGPYRYVFDASEYAEYRFNSVLGGTVNDSLLDLKHLSYLDLSYNNFEGISIPKFFGSLQSLRYLNLSRAGFGGIIPPQLGNLSNLQYLNLHATYLNRFSFGTDYRLNVEKLDWISSLSSLEFLDMSGVDLSQSIDWLEVISPLSSLIELHLSQCSLPNLNPPCVPSLNLSSISVLHLSENYLGGLIPNSFQNMTSSFLRELDLSYNIFNSSIPNWFYGLTHLQLLDLNFNQFQGQISSDIGNLTSLTRLDMSENDKLLELEKGIPTSFRNFCSLRSLSMRYVKLNQEINDVLAIMSSGSCVSNVLQSLDLSYCELSGHLTDDFSYFKNLIKFDISGNSISGPVPLSFGELNSLEYLSLSNNRLNGSLSFENLTRLAILDASGNNIALRVRSDCIPPLQLQYLGLASWHIGPQFPKWLHLLKHLTYLDLSNSGISTPVPIWFWDSFNCYQYLNFSHNQIHGSIPNIPFCDRFRPLIDLSSNHFSGVVPYFSPYAEALDLSNNSFSGSISHFLCNNMNEIKQMEVLNLERNLLHGEIPDCWRSWNNLAALKLSNNKFTGNIPDSIGTLRSLESIHLRNNNLSCEIPSTIQNCKRLVILDLSENNLVGNVPTWIGDGFHDLSILSLHANKFNGYLSKQLCRLVSLHILDLAHNSFRGPIPSCFSNFTGMVSRNDSSGSIYTSSYSAFTESALLVMKGKVMEYSTNLGFLRSIDLSDNNLSGEIPEELTILKELLSLNLSHNALTGRIPNHIGDMKGLDAIDFSHNNLSGEIPSSMSTLGFLGTLDLSYNNLFGRIPSGTHLQGFNSSSFTGNQLCGLPLVVNCTGDGTRSGNGKQPDGDEDETDDWFYISMAYGFGAGFWTVMSSLIFIKRWRHFYFGFLHNLWEKIWWSCYCRLL